MNLVTLTMVFLAGILAGALLPYFSDCLIRRKEKPEKPARKDRIIFDADIVLKNSICLSERLKGIFHDIYSSLTENRSETLIIITLNSVGWLYTAWMIGLNLPSIQIMVILSIALIISIIDIKIQIIPNEMVLILFVPSLLFALGGTVKQPISLHFLGLAIGLAFFIIPFFLHSNIGGGDIKYAAAMGFCLGYPDIIKAMMIFSGILLAWLLFLLISKRGGLKMKFAMGPFISIGFVATLLF